ncbi:Ig-like domain-containing protein, partial [Erysipelothrix rhusiopathiae]|nr:Ig-like domain-containing protein [Erysipelothrix rhusiopathiae]
IIITDGKGKEIGKGTVDSEGNFDVKTDRPLEPNEVITITPQTERNRTSNGQLGRELRCESRSTIRSQ